MPPPPSMRGWGPCAWRTGVTRKAGSKELERDKSQEAAGDLEGTLSCGRIGCKKYSLCYRRHKLHLVTHGERKKPAAVNSFFFLFFFSFLNLVRNTEITKKRINLHETKADAEKLRPGPHNVGWGTASGDERTGSRAGKRDRGWAGWGLGREGRGRGLGWGGRGREICTKK